MITVFTPAFNRADLLARLYHSLEQQTDNNFEWIIVDDGSTDGTKEVVSEMICDSSMTIRYYWKENGGKHTAFNYGVEKAHGEWFFCIDSDDIVPIDAIKKINKHVKVLDESVKTIIGYKTDFQNQMLCRKIDSSKVYDSINEVMMFGGGEYAIIIRTDFLLQHLFPVIKGEKFVTESVLYDRIDQCDNNVEICDSVLTQCEYQSSGLSANIYKLLLNNPTGYLIYHMQRIDIVSGFFQRIRHCISYNAFKKMSRNDEYSYSGKYRYAVAVTVPLGCICACYYVAKSKRLL